MNQQDFLSKPNIHMYRNLVTPKYTASLVEIAGWVAGGKCRTIVEKVRQLYKEGKPKEADELKKTIPAFTASGLCREKRVLKNMWAYSQYLVLDIDDLTPEQLIEAKARAVAIPYSVFVFVSPSGYGLKVIVKVDSSLQEHKEAYSQVKSYYEHELGYECDNTDDAVRLCFLSYDPTAELNLSFETFHIVADAGQRVIATTQTTHSDVPVAARPRLTENHGNYLPAYGDLFEHAIRTTENKSQFKEGNRNNFIFLLSCNCNRYGIPENATTILCTTRYRVGDFNESEIRNIIISAYKNTEIFGTWEVEYSEPDVLTQPEENLLIPDTVYDNLPEPLKTITGLFDKNFERDLILLSVITTCSALFPHVHGRYDRKRVGLNLFLFITARASAGKGVINWARELTTKISEYLHMQFKQQYRKYLLDYDDYTADRKNQPDALPPIEPKEPHLLIPANSSCSMLYEILNANRNFGLMLETEADALITTLKKDWGDFSFLLRNAFHHELISMTRRGNKEFIQVQSPQISVVLSGTHSALVNFNAGLENGFFSRFMQYMFNAPVEWKDKFGDDGVDMEQVFESHSDFFLQVWKKYENANSIQIKIKAEQRQKFFSFFKARLEQLYDTNGEDIVACVNRHAIIAYRIGMVLTVLRYLSAGKDLHQDIFMEDIDYETAMQITDVLLMLLEKVFVKLQNGNKSVGRSQIRNRIYQHLPAEFSKAEYNTMIVELGEQVTTAEKYLTQLKKGGLVESLGHGRYKKNTVPAKPAK